VKSAPFIGHGAQSFSRMVFTTPLRTGSTAR
jgi:hypothetical protein